MDKYIRKLFKHDIDKQISVTKSILKDYFEDQDNFKVKGHKSGDIGDVTILRSTDPRFGGDIKKLMAQENSYAENDYVIFSKVKGKPYKYILEVLTAQDSNYKFFDDMITNTERHTILYLDDEADNMQENQIISETEEEYGEENNENLPSDLSNQRIFFGAPGTGKSYNLNIEAQKYFGNNYERVTFHPNYLYGNLVGSYKPFPKRYKDENGKYITDENGHPKETITYEFIPGILINVLTRAFLNPDKNFLLLIEEINRANVSAVFGDLFQLLDRNSVGESEYTIAVSKELQEYFERVFSNETLRKDIHEKLGMDYQNLFFPKNLFIWASMNSADQGVMPMDTAFKRRWEFEYLGINDIADQNANEFKNYELAINNSEKVKWDDFRREINERLSKLNIPEDKLLGPYFISKSTLESSDLNKVTNVIKNKVLMYLYDDAARAYRNTLFAEGKHSTFSQLCKEFEKNALNIFKTKIEIETISINAPKIDVNNENEIADSSNADIQVFSSEENTVEVNS